jgi:hypothetical protein
VSGPEVGRLLFLLDTVAKEGRHLLDTTGRLFSQPIDVAWVEGLERQPELAERVDAFGARFGRTQDTMGNKLIPELLRCLQETPEAIIDNLNRMEKLGILASVRDWLEARNLRNRLVHEYVRDPAEFAAALRRAYELVPMLAQTYNRLNDYARARFGDQVADWPPKLTHRLFDQMTAV